MRSATPGERTWAASLDLRTVGLTDFAAALDVLDSLDWGAALGLRTERIRAVFSGEPAQRWIFFMLLGKVVSCDARLFIVSHLTG